MNTEVLHYGITKQNVNNDFLDIKIEEIKYNGYTILEDIFSVEEMQKAAVCLDKIMHEQVLEIGGEINLRKANDNDIVRCPLAYNSLFLSFSTNKIILELMRRILGENFILLMQNGIINKYDSDQYQVRWHRDLLYQHWTSTKIICLNFLICIDKFFKDGGCTWAIPGSHLHEMFPSNEFIHKHAIPIEANVGSIIVMDAMCYHRAGVNNTEGFIRRALNHVVGAPILAQQIDIPRFIYSKGQDYSKDVFLSKYLGYKWNPPANAYEWRLKHTKSEVTGTN